MNQLLLMFSGGVITLMMVDLVFIAPYRESGPDVLNSLGWIGAGMLVTSLMLVVFVLIPFGEAFEP